MLVSSNHLDKFSLIGGFGYSLRHTNVKEFLPVLPAQMTVIRKGEDKAKPNPFEDFTEEGKKFFESVQKVRDEELFKALFAAREKHLKNKKIDLDQMKKKLQSKPFFELSELIEGGLIDEVGYAEDMMISMGHGKGELSITIPDRTYHNWEWKAVDSFHINQLLSNRFRHS